MIFSFYQDDPVLNPLTPWDRPPLRNIFCMYGTDLKTEVAKKVLFNIAENLYLHFLIFKECVCEWFYVSAVHTNALKYAAISVLQIICCGSWIMVHFTDCTALPLCG